MATPQRLSALDATFLALSSPEVPFVPGCVLMLDRPLALAPLEARIEALVEELPRYRQRIVRAPLIHSLAWIDDTEFLIERHVDVLHVPAPGGQRELEEAVAELLTAGVPEDHPPWRVWTVEGLADGGGALIAVVHHALVDGVAGIGLLERLLRLTPESGASAQPVRQPDQRGKAKPILERVIERVAADLRGRAAAWNQLTHELDPRHQASTLGALLLQGLRPSSDLQLDGRAASRDRSFAMVTFPLDEAKAIKRTFAVTVNDVMLACISGTLRRYVARLGVDPDRLDDVRAMVPVNRHGRDEHATSGNRVALLLTALSVDEPDATRRLHRIAETTRSLKARDMAGAGDMLVALSNLTWSGVLTNVFRLALWRRAFRIVITNVPGPPVPLYLLDARVTRFAPVVNLWPGTPLAFAIGSYAGTLTVTVDADRAQVPDVAPLVEDLQQSFAELRDAARAASTVQASAG
ncbi:MAG TPA: wax ester/triacylglycerol synthase domain-containing protein [Kofleriaceae bacterium]|nr:wax ester/triacylglycerol synthase domain-containing protein [Kofleriaceae bacterium]